MQISFDDFCEMYIHAGSILTFNLTIILSLILTLTPTLFDFCEMHISTGLPQPYSELYHYSSPTSLQACTVQ